MQGKKLETWCILPSNKEYLSVEPTTALLTNWPKAYSLVKWTAKYGFLCFFQRNNCFNELL